jgi:electron transfer flavoprotein alpha subunit
MAKSEIWTLAEHKNGILESVSFELLAWGSKLKGGEDRILCSVVLADKLNEEEVQKLIEFGAERVYFVSHPAFAAFSVESYADGLIEIIHRYSPEILIASATTTGRTIMPVVSVLSHGGLTADCTGLEIDKETGLLLQTRPAIGGNILATIKTPICRPQMSTVRPKSLPVLPRDPARKGEVIQVDLEGMTIRQITVLEQFIPDKEEGPNIEAADIVVAGGKGLKNKNNFALIEKIAAELAGAVGASRPPVDQGWMPYACQIGLSGKTISPALYIACGISGTIQHLAGIQTAKNIVAINNDPQAQIFQVADFGIVTDLFEFLPIFAQKLGKRK